MKQDLICIQCSLYHFPIINCHIKLKLLTFIIIFFYHWEIKHNNRQIEAILKLLTNSSAEVE